MGKHVGLEELLRVGERLTAVCAGLDPDAVPVVEVAAVHGELVRLRRLVEGAVTRMARRVADLEVHRVAGKRDAASYLADSQGITRQAAERQLATSVRLQGLEATDAAVRAGELSEVQAAEVAEAATVDPEAESVLLVAAGREPVSVLRDRARRLRAAACPDRDARLRRIHAQRMVSRWTDSEGAYNLRFRGTPEMGGRIDARLAVLIDRELKAARREGRREPLERYAADALVEAIDPTPEPVGEGRCGCNPGDQGSVSATGSAREGPVSRSGDAAGSEQVALLDWPGDQPEKGDTSESAGDTGQPDGGSRTDGGSRDGGASGGADGGDAGAGVSRGGGFVGGDGVRAGDGSAGGAGAAHEDGCPQAGAGGGQRRRVVSRARQSKVIVLVDAQALRRGHAQGGEVCEIAGVGQVPVAAVEAVLPEAFAAVVIRDGEDVVNVTHLGRQVTERQRTALEVRGYRCEVPGCGGRQALEIDHVVGWAATRATRLDDLAWLCPAHHRRKTYEGWRLEGRPHHRRWVSPSGRVVTTDPDPP